MKLQHVIESQQFQLPILLELFNNADAMEKILQRGGTRDYERSIMASLFYEPSTRTRFSFESAMRRLGGSVLSTERAQEFSSVSLGESLEDTIRVAGQFADVLVLRSNEIGGAKRASLVSPVPVINAGDGKGGQHPTQALLDLYTIYRERRSIEGVRVALVGNLLDGRTVRSLAYLLGKFDRVKIYFVAPPPLQMKQDLLAHLDAHGVWFALEDSLEKVLPEIDVVYMTRIEPERMADLSPGTSTAGFYLDRSLLGMLPAASLVMHPLPRLSEIAPEVDNDPRAVYFKQAQYGVLVRMALLAACLE